ncbi:threonine--tRNA ligase [Cohnella phaseoli]|uniref:Threonine--tRNA ligase n=1 Tax=Cohnella phaseoli TaxID=456490 RepID=A0A3D9ICD1_9BACL|nr:threonine--tRNA ligase [Cohnella phaseoli]RED59432.1 threonyl-tRNA synthetase [Cohnella phaseoli]
MYQSKQDQVKANAAMLLAWAMQRKFAGAKLGGAFVTEQGFYYDFEVPGAFAEADLAVVEEEMRKLSAKISSCSLEPYSRMEAAVLFEARGESWKAEWLREEAESDEVQIYRQEEFVDVYPDECAREVGKSAAAFKLLSVAGAYWRGDNSRPMLQRIYGAAFASEAELKQFLSWQEEAARRDHRKLGKQLQLIHFSEEAPGMPFYLPKGAVVRQELENLSRQFLRKYDYEEVRTPLIMNRQMWEQSGHWEHYRDNMYFSELDNHQFAVKPMNCPGHMLIYKSQLRSYRDLPIRLAEFGQVHRHEFSGALNGLFRVRTFCQDDAHIFVRPDQIEEEIGRAIAMIQEMYGLFGFEYSLELSTRPDDSMGSDEQWGEAEAALAQVLKNSGLPYRINPGDGAFYGPKIDFHIKDALNRSHQCATVQLDFQMPEKFGLAYVDEKNEKRTPIVIHRAIYGSIDRFMGILIEHYAGAFPVWLAPVQAVLVPVSENHAAYAEQVCRRLKEAGIRAEADCRNEKLGYRIREAQLMKAPYVAVVGDAEIAAGTVQARLFGEQGQRELGLNDFVAELCGKVERREG